MKEVKICTKCSIEKPVNEFYAKRKRGKLYRMPECKQCEIQRSLAWRENNRDKSRENKKKWSSNNKEKVAITRRKHRKNNSDKIKEYNNKWYAKNPDKYREYYQRRKARRSEVPTGPKPTKQERLEIQGGMCANCKIKGKKVKWHYDHIIAIKNGGSDTADNMEVLCSTCNQRKHSKSSEQWAYENGRLL